MADVNGTLGRRIREADRGQLILITGLVMAIAIVVLVLLLNTVIYTENLATRGIDGDGRDAIQYQQTTIQGAGEVVDGENFREHSDYADVRDNVDEGIVQLDARLERRNVPYTAVADIDSGSIDLTEGKLVRQTDESRDFKAGDTLSEDWTLATDVENVRHHRVSVNQNDLNETDPGNATDYAFHVQLNNGTNQWRLYIYEDESDLGNVSIAVKNGSDTDPTLLPSCAVNGPEATIDLTRGTVNGTECTGIQWAKGIEDEYDIEYKNGHEATGTYHTIVDTSAAGDVVDTVTYTLGNGQPYRVDAVYSAEFKILYETPEITYETTVRVAPGEPS